MLLQVIKTIFKSKIGFSFKKRIKQLRKHVSVNIKHSKIIIQTPKVIELVLKLLNLSISVLFSLLTTYIFNI